MPAKPLSHQDMDDHEDVILAKELEAAGQEAFGSSSSMEVEPTEEEIQKALDAMPKPDFPALKRSDVANLSKEYRLVPIPPHRLSPLKKDWLKICSPLVEHLKLHVRMNVKRKAVELKSCKDTVDTGAIQKGADFLRAFTLGFEIADAMALLRLDELYIDTFEIKDVRTLHGDNLSRAIGRIVGKDGRTKFAIENSSRTRIVVADQKIHILGSFTNIRIAKDAVVSLIIGASPGKVYTRLRTIAARAKERF
ncbi:pre-rRNA-processing protein pno1 [Chytridiales sp. JEL 0842]|nr:pre-rRNA-processing protein pno1 [Chytridiales sp. JEL 0842]